MTVESYFACCSEFNCISLGPLSTCGKSLILLILSKCVTFSSSCCAWCYKSEASSLAADLAVD